MADDEKAPVTRTDPVTGQLLTIEFEEIESLSHGDAEALLAYWRRCRQSGSFVMSPDVPAKAIARLTKHLVVLEPLADYVDFKYRLTGMVLIERLNTRRAGRRRPCLPTSDARFLRDAEISRYWKPLEQRSARDLIRGFDDHSVVTTRLARHTHT